MILNSTKGLHESAFIHRWWNSIVQTSQFWLRRLLWVRYFYTRWRSSKCAYVSIRLFKHSRGCHLVTGLCYGPWIDLSLVVYPLSSVLLSKCIHTDPHLSASVFIYLELYLIGRNLSRTFLTQLNSSDLMLFKSYRAEIPRSLQMCHS